MERDLGALREEYQALELLEENLSANPFEQFDRWFQEAEKAGKYEANVMTLATTSKEGQPSARQVLLKGYNTRQGFFFASNYSSQKARELEDNPRAALLFHWAGLQRQVRIEGLARRSSPEESANYFKSRPRGSQIGAWASYQSHPLENRAQLEERVRELEARFAGQPVPWPEFWGGYWLQPQAMEFWQGRANRLHDRFRFLLQADNQWVHKRLAP